MPVTDPLQFPPARLSVRISGDVNRNRRLFFVPQFPTPHEASERERQGARCSTYRFTLLVIKVAAAVKVAAVAVGS